MEMMEHRDTLEIIFDVLTDCQNREKNISRICLTTRLSHTSLSPLLKKLLKVGYLRNIESDFSVHKSRNSDFYCITKKGIDFKENIKEWCEFDFN